MRLSPGHSDAGILKREILTPSIGLIGMTNMSVGVSSKRRMSERQPWNGR